MAQAPPDPTNPQGSPAQGFFTKRHAPLWNADEVWGAYVSALDDWLNRRALADPQAGNPNDHRIAAATIVMILIDMRMLAAHGAPPLEISTYYGGCILVSPLKLQLIEKYDIGPHIWTLVTFSEARQYDLSNEADVLQLVERLERESFMPPDITISCTVAAPSN